MFFRRSTVALAVAGATACVAFGPLSAQAVVPTEIVDTYTTDVVVLGITQAHDSLTVAAVRGTTAVKVVGERATAGLCAGFTDNLENGGPSQDDPSITEFGSRVSIVAKDFQGYGGNGCAGRWKLTYTATGPNGGKDTGGRLPVHPAGLALPGRQRGPEPIASGAAVTTSATLQRASFADVKYHGWVTPVEAQFKTKGTWKTYRTLTPSAAGKVAGTLHQRVTGCWRRWPSAPPRGRRRQPGRLRHRPLTHGRPAEQLLNGTTSRHPRDLAPRRRLVRWTAARRSRVGGRGRLQVGALLLGLALTCSCTGAEPREEPAAAGSAAPTAAGPAPGRPPWSGWRPCAAPELAPCAAGRCPCRSTAAPRRPAGRTLLARRRGGRGPVRRPHAALPHRRPGPARRPVRAADRSRCWARSPEHYRVVLVDQRGTGANALVCPLLQQQIGYADLEVPTDGRSPSAAPRSARTPRTTARPTPSPTSSDLRRALGVRRWSIDGVSYGTYVAQRYAARAPGARSTGWCSTRWSRSTRSRPRTSSPSRTSRPCCATSARAEHCPGDPAAGPVRRRRALPARARPAGRRLADVGGRPVLPRPARARCTRRPPAEPAALQRLVRARGRTAAPVRPTSSARACTPAPCAWTCTFPWGGADAAPAGRAQGGRPGGRPALGVRSCSRSTRRRRAATARCAPASCGRRSPTRPARSSLSLTRGARAAAARLARPVHAAGLGAAGQADLPGVRLVVVPGAGHAVQSARAGFRARPGGRVPAG